MPKIADYGILLAHVHQSCEGRLYKVVSLGILKSGVFKFILSLQSLYNDISPYLYNHQNRVHLTNALYFNIIRRFTYY